MLIQEIRQRGVDFVGEAAHYGEETIAARLCGLEHILYANIDMTPQERESRKIPPGQDDDPNLSEEDRNRCHHQREEQMCKRALSHAGEKHSAVLICGRLHITAISSRLMQLSHSVETADLQD